MKESTSFLKREFVIPWQSLANSRTARRLPRTISSMQIILLCGLVSVLLLRSTIGGSNLSSSTPVTSGPISKHSLAGIVNSRKRNIAQVDENDVEDSEGRETNWDDNIVVVASEKSTMGNEVKTESNSKEESKEDQTAKVHVEEKTIEELEVEQKVKVDSTQQRKLESSKAESDELPWVPSDSKPFTFSPKIKDWDEQRAAWLEKNPSMKSNPAGKPRMLLVTGSQPWACKNPVGDHYLLKSAKNKIDYCRQHHIDIFYNFAHLDRSMSSYWAKLPILRKLMLLHPEVEWFFWMDSDAMFTDMLFEIPMHKYTEHNFVMWGYDDGIYKEKSWVAINNGVFFIRNCQWTLDLFDMWAPMGPEGAVRIEAGKMLTSYLTKRPEMPADDQSALAYLIVSKEELRSKVKLEWDYWLSGYWADIVEHYEEFMTKHHPGLGDTRWPFTTHFTGCQPCSGKHNPAYSKDDCVNQMERAFNFADNQVVQMFGFQHESLESAHLKRIKEDTDHPLDSVGQNPWATAAESFGL